MSVTYIVFPKWSLQGCDPYWENNRSSVFDFGQEELMSAGLGFWHVKRSGLCLHDKKLSVMMFQDMLPEENTEDISNTYLLTGNSKDETRFRRCLSFSESSVASQKSQCHCPPQLGSWEKSLSRHQSNTGHPVSQENSSTLGSDKDLKYKQG